MKETLTILWMLFWQLVFIFCILWWAWFPIALGLWEYKEPRWVRLIVDQTIGLGVYKY